MLTRIYGLAFPTENELKDFIKKRELALKRDHRKLGQELELFTISEEVGKGLPLWLPNGTVIREELEKLAKELEFKDGYVRVGHPAYREGGALQHFWPPQTVQERHVSPMRSVRGPEFPF